MASYVPRSYYEYDDPEIGRKICLEVMMFNDHGYILNLKRRIARQPWKYPKDLLRHLRWLIEAGEKAQAKAQCPICKSETVRSFSIKGNGSGLSFGPSMSCCANANSPYGDNTCKRELEAGSPDADPEFKDFKFSSLDIFTYSDERQKAARMFKWAFGIKSLTKEKAFKVFERTNPQRKLWED